MPETTESTRPASRPGRLPDVVYAQASPRSLGGVSLFDEGARIDAATVEGFTCDEDLVRTAARRLRDAGFAVLQESPVTINIAGPPERYQEAFGARLVTEERPVLKGGAREDTATFVEAPETELPGLIDVTGSRFGDVLEGVAIEEPRYPHQSPFPPTRAYWHLDVPGDVSLGCEADRAHRAGVTGRDVTVVMTDTGWFAHPYFAQRGYRASVVLGPGAADPETDTDGHGTAESANVFAVAPDVDFTMVKTNFVNTVGAFNAAVGLAPRIISNSWGSDVRYLPMSAANQALAASIALAVSDGVVVVFSAGNGHFGFPGQHPDVISAGGVFMAPDGELQASDYASGFASNIYPDRNVPDVCGLVGMLPRAAYIMLPLPPGSAIDRDLAKGGAHPAGDETEADDGWAAISGTSAAAPQLAGVCALVMEACPQLDPAAVREILRATARDVTTGACSPRTGGHPATPGADLATGSGLVNAHRAVMLARARCGAPDAGGGEAP